MISWTDIQDKIVLPGTHRYSDGVAWSYAAGGVIEDGAAPRVYDQTIVNAVFTRFGDTLRHIAADEDMPVELLAAPICMVAENVGVDAATHYTNHLPGFMGDDETPNLVYVGCTGLRLDYVRAAVGHVMVQAYVAHPATAITAAAKHILAQLDMTHFQIPMVAAAYGAEGVRYDATSRWSMGGEIDRFVGWFNTIVQVAQFDPTLIAAAPSFTAVLARIVPPTPQDPSTNTPAQRYRRPESQAAIDAGMMTISQSNPGLCAIWSLDDTTLMQIGNVAKDAASPGIGLPMGLPVFAYPDRGGTMRIMNATEVQALYRAMRDFVMAITMYDTGRAPGLPGQPVGIG